MVSLLETGPKYLETMDRSIRSQYSALFCLVPILHLHLSWAIPECSIRSFQSFWPYQTMLGYPPTLLQPSEPSFRLTYSCLGWICRCCISWCRDPAVWNGHMDHDAGDGYSSRAEDSILNGCIPVVIMDNVDAVFETILDWKSFSIRIKEVTDTGKLRCCLRDMSRRVFDEEGVLHIVLKSDACLCPSDTLLMMSESSLRVLAFAEWISAAAKCTASSSWGADFPDAVCAEPCVAQIHV